MPAAAFSLYHAAVLASALGLAVADYRTRTVKRVYWLPLVALGAYNAFDTTLLLLGTVLLFSLGVGVAFHLFGAGLADWIALAVFPFVVPTVWPYVLGGTIAIAAALVWMQVYESDDVPFFVALFPALVLTLIFLPA